MVQTKTKRNKKTNNNGTKKQIKGGGKIAAISEDYEKKPKSSFGRSNDYTPEIYIKKIADVIKQLNTDEGFITAFADIMAITDEYYKSRFLGLLDTKGIALINNGIIISMPVGSQTPLPNTAARWEARELYKQSLSTLFDVATSAEKAAKSELDANGVYNQSLVTLNETVEAATENAAAQQVYEQSQVTLNETVDATIDDANKRKNAATQFVNDAAKITKEKIAKAKAKKDAEAIELAKAEAAEQAKKEAEAIELAKAEVAELAKAEAEKKAKALEQTEKEAKALEQTEKEAKALEQAEKEANEEQAEKEAFKTKIAEIETALNEANEIAIEWMKYEDLDKYKQIVEEQARKLEKIYQEKKNINDAAEYLKIKQIIDTAKSTGELLYALSPLYIKGKSFMDITKNTESLDIIDDDRVSYIENKKNNFPQTKPIVDAWLKLNAINYAEQVSIQMYFPKSEITSYHGDTINFSKYSLIMGMPNKSDKYYVIRQENVDITAITINAGRIYAFEKSIIENADNKTIAILPSCIFNERELTDSDDIFYVLKEYNRMYDKIQGFSSDNALELIELNDGALKAKIGNDADDTLIGWVSVDGKYTKTYPKDITVKSTTKPEPIKDMSSGWLMTTESNGKKRYITPDGTISHTEPEAIGENGVYKIKKVSIDKSGVEVGVENDYSNYK